MFESLKFPGLNFASTPQIPGAEAGGGSPSAGPAVSPQPPAAPAAQPTGQPPESDNIRQLRQAYEGIKRDFEPWQKLGVKVDEVQTYRSVHDRMFQEIGAIGRELGFPDAEIIEAMKEDPVATLDYLRRASYEQQQGRGQDTQGRDLQELIEQGISQRMGPIEQRENLRMTNEANSLAERTIHKLATDSFKAEGIDASQIVPDEMDMLMTATLEVMKYDEDALRALKYEGKTAAIQKAFSEARTLLDKYYLARVGRDRTRVGTPGPPRPGQPPQAPGKKPTLDELANSPELINAKYAEGR